MFAQAREKARQTSCPSNLKQIGTATGMYVQDYDETFPLYKWSSIAPTWTLPDGKPLQTYISWPLQFYPYIKNIQVYTCPSDTLAEERVGKNFDKPIPLSYATNGDIFNGLDYATKRAGNAVAMAYITHPADTYWITEENYRYPFGFHPDDPNIADDPYKFHTFNRAKLTREECGGIEHNGAGLLRLKPGFQNGEACARHTGGNVILFADGHAKWEKWNAMKSAKARYTRPN